jgi:hypothetical protein
MLSVLVFTLLLLEQQQPPTATGRLQVFLDCNDCFADYLREETDFVDFVRDRTQATVHVIITNTGTASGGLEYMLAFIGQAAFSGQDTTLKAVTQTGDPERVRRQQLLTTLRIGLLSYLARVGVPQGLQLDVELPASAQAPGVRQEITGSSACVVRLRSTARSRPRRGRSAPRSAPIGSRSTGN